VTAPLRLYFTRHGESLANAYDRAGERRPKDWDRLSERGWEQARGVGRRLRGEGVDLILASTMVRAQETAQGIAETLGVPVETDPDLHEIRQSDAFYAASPDFGETGLLSWMPRTPRDQADGGGESFDDVVARVQRVQARLLDLAATRRVLAVSHFNFLHFFLGVATFGEAFGPEHLRPLFRIGHDNTGVTVFEHGDHRVLDGYPLPGWTLRTWNDQAHL
jgi:probable phosphoglycerate mutase